MQKINPETLAILIKNALLVLDGLVYSDEELVRTINRSVGPAMRITERTYRRYKKAAMDNADDNNPLYGELHGTLIDCNIAQKRALTDKMMETENSQWLKYRWLLERKFPEYNLRHQSDRFLKESAQRDEDDRDVHSEGAGPKKPTPTKTKTMEDQKEEVPEKTFRLGMVDMEGNDWSDFIDQKYRKIHADCKGEPFTEEWLTEPAPLTTPYWQQQKEKKEAEERMKMTDDKLQMEDEGMSDGKLQMADGGMADERRAHDKEQMPNGNTEMPEDDFDISKIKGDPEWGTTDEEERAYQIERRAWLKVQGRPYSPGARPYNDDEDDDNSESLNIPRDQVQVYDMDALMKQAMEQREQQQKQQQQQEQQQKETPPPPTPEPPKKTIYPPGTKKIWGIK